MAEENESILRCLEVAKHEGVPRDQAEKFLSHAYVPLPWQWKYHSASREADKPNGPIMVACGGARGPGKSHAILAQMALDDCQRVPGLKALFLRQTGKAAKESFEDLVGRILAKRIPYEYKSSVIRFENGSRILLGGFKDDKDIDKYIGIEYDVIGGEELNQLSESKITQLRGSLRTSKEGWRPRLYASFNPGGVGHGYVKATFVEPYRAELEKQTRFIPATYKDNPYINVEYNDYLESLSGQLGAAWRDGDFDILAGQFFTEWRPDISVVEPFDIEPSWRRFASMDYGFRAQSAIYWYAVSPSADVYVYRELYRTGLSFTQLAEEFSALTGTVESIEYLVCDPSIWNRDGHSEGGLSGAELFESRYHELQSQRDSRRSIHLERGNNDRLNGWNVVREYIKPIARDGKPTTKLRIFDTCFNLIRTIPLQVHDITGNPEDLDTEIEDHAVDSLRYGLMSRPTPRATVDEIAKREFALAMKRKLQRQGGRPSHLFIK